MKGLSLSLSLAASSDGQQLPVCSQARMVLIVPASTADCSVSAPSEPQSQPPNKRMRVETDGEEKMKQENSSALAVHSISPLEALRQAVLASQAMACVVVSAPLPSFSSSSMEAAVIASWCEEGGGGGGGGDGDIVESTKLCRVVISAEDICSERLKCSADCFGLWKGKRV